MDVFKNSVSEEYSDDCSEITSAKSTEITLEDIRAALEANAPTDQILSSRLFTESKQCSSPIAHVSARSTKMEQVEREPVEKLLYLCYELLGLIELLEHKRVKAVEEWAEISEVVGGFERLYDSVRVRDSQFLNKVIEQQNKFDMRDSKYQHLMQRALQHLEDFQKERSRLFSDTVSMNARQLDFQAQLETVQTCIKEHREKLDKFQLELQSMPSEKETTELNLRLRHYQNENTQLETDRAELKMKYDELSLELQKRHPLLQPYEAYLSKRKSSIQEASECPVDDGDDFELVAMKDRMLMAIQEQKSEFESSLHKLLHKKKEYESYKNVLQNLIKTHQSGMQRN